MTESTIDDRIERLEAMVLEQQDLLSAQREEIAVLRAERGKPSRGSGVRKPMLSRASLLKGAAAGVAGLAAAELSGTLGATPSYATTTDTNLVATGGGGTGVQVGGHSSTDYGYDYGGVLYGQFYGLKAIACDSSGQLNDFFGMYGLAGGYGVWGDSPSGDGIHGSSTNGDGVYGEGGDRGVHGHSSSGVGVMGQSDSKFGGWFGGGLALIYLQPAGAAGPPSSGGHFLGEIMIDITGVPYVCTSGNGGSVGTWQAIGNLRSFPDPRRVYANGSVAAGSTVGPINATLRTNGTASGVPAGAKAIYCAVQSYQSGVMTLFPDGAPDPGIANWSVSGTGGLNMLYLLVPLSAAGKFKFHIYFTGSVYIDGWGYLL